MCSIVFPSIRKKKNNQRSLDLIRPSIPKSWNVNFKSFWRALAICRCDDFFLEKTRRIRRPCGDEWYLVHRYFGQQVEVNDTLPSHQLTNEFQHEFPQISGFFNWNGDTKIIETSGENFTLQGYQLTTEFRVSWLHCLSHGSPFPMILDRQMCYLNSLEWNCKTNPDTSWLPGVLNDR